jgi:pimeloyl-ACP methyl ester carboxylesterase
MTNISFSVRGEGAPVILLHGFPFHQKIWDDFATRLSSVAKVYTPDLPGFGKSASLGKSFSLDTVADVLLAWIESEGIPQAILVGHSLGGYVALAMARKKSNLFPGLILFHSTAFADSDEKKESRSKVVTFVQQHGAEKFTSNFIEPLFVDGNNAAVVRVREIAKQASAQTVIAYTEAMRDRKSHEQFLGQFRNPILFLAGQKDQGIPINSIHQQAAYCQNAEVHTLIHSAHMGMFEQETEALQVIGDFIARTFRIVNP